MKTSLDKQELYNYLKNQLNTFFPDKYELHNLKEIIDKSLEKIEFNFKHINLNHYYKDDNIYFNHLNADQYTVFIYYCSNIAYEVYKNVNLASKLFYLNKTLNNFHCMYDTKLPDIFIIIHGNGIVLGKAKYSDFLVVMQGCTIGSNSKWEAPTLQKGLIMYPNSSLIGNSKIKTNTCLSNGVLLIDHNTQGNTTVISKDNCLIEKKQKTDKLHIYFKKEYI